MVDAIETVTVDADELEYVRWHLSDVEDTAEEIAEFVEELREKIAFVLGFPGYQWRTKLPADLRSLLDEIENAARDAGSTAGNARRMLCRLAEGE